MERLIDLVNHLPAGTLLSTTPEFERAAGRKLTDASILQACSLVIDAGYQDKEAELSPDGKTIKVYAGGLWIPWPAFTISEEVLSRDGIDQVAGYRRAFEQGMRFDPAESTDHFD